MRIDEQLIQQIVSDVMERLHAPDDAPGTMLEPVASAQLTETARAADECPPILENVITEELLEARLVGKRPIVIGRKSILTPSARDLLRNRGIEWTRTSATEANDSRRIGWKAIVVDAVESLPRMLNELSGSTGSSWNRESAACAADASALAISAVCRAEAIGVVVLTQRPEAVACRSNRHRQVRAAAVGDVGRVRSVRTAMGANLYCVDPRGLSFFELRNLLREIASGEPPQPPGDWTE